MNKEIQELLRTTKVLQDKLDSLMRIQQSAIDGLPEAEKAKLSFFDRDVQEMKNALRERDMDKIQTFLTKYADNSPKH